MSSTYLTLHRDRTNIKEGPKDTRATAIYTSLEHALTHKWTTLKKRQAKELNPAVVFSILGGYSHELPCLFVLMMCQHCGSFNLGKERYRTTPFMQRSCKK
jgi:hypothetical protein